MDGIRKTWRVKGMHCVHCEQAVERALQGLDGLSDMKVSYRKGTLTALYRQDVLSEAEIRQRVQQAGYDLAEDSKKDSLGIEILRLIVILAILGAAYWAFTQTPLANWLNAFPVARTGMSLGALFLVGLMTSLHCVAMCGGINVAQSARSAQKGIAVRGSVMYNLGRVVSYTLTGAVIGLLGKVFSLTPAVKAGLQIAAAVFMLIMALNLMGGFTWLRRLNISMPRGLSAKLAGLSGGRSSFVVGLANGLMPCGPLQSMQLYALSTGSAWMGAMSMLCFSLGTVPLMLGVGLVSGRMNRRFARPMQVFSAMLVIMMGLSMLSNGLNLAGVSVGATAGLSNESRISDGVQEVYTELDYGNYPTITVQTGIPVKWTIYADEAHLNGCNNAIVIPAYGLEKSLEVGENVIEFTPETAGTISYTCWMGMLRGSIQVVDGEETT